MTDREAFEKDLMDEFDNPSVIERFPEGHQLVGRYKWISTEDDWSIFQEGWQASRTTLEPAPSLAGKEPGQSVKELASRLREVDSVYDFNHKLSSSEAVQEIQSHVDQAVDQQTRELRLMLDQAIKCASLKPYKDRIEIVDEYYEKASDYPELASELASRAALSTGNNLEVEKT